MLPRPRKKEINRVINAEEEKVKVGCKAQEIFYVYHSLLLSLFRNNLERQHSNKEVISRTKNRSIFVFSADRIVKIFTFSKEKFSACELNSLNIANVVNFILR